MIAELNFYQEGPELEKVLANRELMASKSFLGGLKATEGTYLFFKPRSWEKDLKTGEITYRPCDKKGEMWELTPEMQAKFNIHRKPLGDYEDVIEFNKTVKAIFSEKYSWKQLDYGAVILGAPNALYCVAYNEKGKYCEILTKRADGDWAPLRNDFSGSAEKCAREVIRRYEYWQRQNRPRHA